MLLQSLHNTEHKGGADIQNLEPREGRVAGGERERGGDAPFPCLSPHDMEWINSCLLRRQRGLFTYTQSSAAPLRIHIHGDRSLSSLLPRLGLAADRWTAVVFPSTPCEGNTTTTTWISNGMFDELQKDKEYLQMSIYLQIYGLMRVWVRKSNILKEFKEIQLP